MKFDSQVVRHASWEMALMRAAFALMVWSSVPFFYYQTTLSHPSGLAHFVNLGFLMNPEILGIFRGLLAVALLFYVIGLFTFSSLSVVTFLLAACGSLENSQGAINHTFQPLGLAALAQWAVSGYWAVRRRLQRGVPFFPLASVDTQRRLTHAAKVALVSCYVTSAVTKLERSDGQWIQRTPNLAIAIVKTNAKSYLNAFEPTSRLAETAPQFIVTHPRLTQIFFGFGFALEFFSFLALLGRWPAVLIGGALIVMHHTISLVMGLHFAIFEQLAFIFLVNSPWLVALMIGKIWRLARRRLQVAAS